MASLMYLGHGAAILTGDSDCPLFFYWYMDAESTAALARSALTVSFRES